MFVMLQDIFWGGMMQLNNTGQVPFRNLGVWCTSVFLVSLATLATWATLLDWFTKVNWTDLVILAK